MICTCYQSCVIFSTRNGGYFLAVNRLNDLRFSSFEDKSAKTQLSKLSQTEGVHSFFWKGRGKYKKKIAGKQVLSPFYLEKLLYSTFHNEG